MMKITPKTRTLLVILGIAVNEAIDLFRFESCLFMAFAGRIPSAGIPILELAFSPLDWGYFLNLTLS